MKHLRILLIPCLMIAFLLVTGTATASRTSPQMGMNAPTLPPSGGMLSAVAVVAHNDVWAAGNDNTRTFNPDALIEHWNGSAWTVALYKIPGASQSIFYGIVALSSSSVWAVGDFYKGHGNSRTLTEHWDGSSWHQISSPNMSSTNNGLDAIAAVSSTDIWTVGSYNGKKSSKTLAEHWNGSKWSIVPSPNVGTGNNSFYGVTAIATNDVWAVGEYDVNLNSSTLIEHWNGSVWSVVPSPSPSQILNQLFAVTAISSSDVWAVGQYSPTNNSNYTNTLSEHWDGGTWSIISSPSPSKFDNHLYAVTSVSTSDIWAVGASNGKTLTLHWDGSVWSIVKSPNPHPSRGGCELFGVSALSSNDVWTVGDNFPGQFSIRTLTEHWNGSKWVIIPSPK